MKAVIQFKNSFNKPEYLTGLNGFTQDLQRARVWETIGEAQEAAENIRSNWPNPPIVNTATVIAVELVVVH